MEKDTRGVVVVSATEFKAKCLGLMDRVKRTRETIVITKHGKPVARLVPPEEAVPSLWGCMAGTVNIVGDIVGPTTPDYDPHEAWPDDWMPVGAGERLEGPNGDSKE